jgi:hypothetical protein
VGYLTLPVYPYSSITVNITPEAMGRIDTVAIGAYTIASYEYIGPFVAQKTYPTTTPMVYQPKYDNLGRITSADSGASLAKFDYEYQPNSNNIASMKYEHRPGDPDVEFRYDRLDRLTQVWCGMDSSDEPLVYELLGNCDFVNRRIQYNSRSVAYCFQFTSPGLAGKIWGRG